MTLDELVSHNHPMDRGRWYGADSTIGTSGSIYNQTSTTTAQGDNTSGAGARRVIGNVGGSQPFNVMQPYITVYVWKRVS